MILVVDDDLDVLSVVRRTLRNVGHPITLVSNPIEALEVLCREPVAVLISDVDMPQMSGHDLLRHTRVEHPSVVRLLMTGRATVPSAVRAINEGEVHRYICKPFESGELHDIVVDALARQRELSQVTEVGVAFERRRDLAAQLELEFPGLTTFARDRDGSYRIDPVRSEAGARYLRSAGVVLSRQPLAELVSGS